MIRLKLTPEENEVLVALLEERLSDLRMEIADTDNQDFRQLLKNRKQVILKVLENLKQGGS